MVAGSQPYGLVEDGAVAVFGEKISWVGERAARPSAYSHYETHDAGGRLVTPALVDCHTHIVHGGNRAREFELRLEGASYEEIARSGGGILATVAATRASGEEELLAQALVRLDSLLADGVGTIEVKSGYGLDTATELRMLRVAKRLAEARPVRVRTSFLGAHALPIEFAGRADDYVDLICDEMLPAAARYNLADAVDGFCEGIAFAPVQIERIFRKSVKLGLPVRLHAEQLSNLGGARLAAGFGALSADHLEYLDEAGVGAMAAAGTVAVLLPGAFYTLRQDQPPPVQALRRAGVPIGVATDCNPGTSPLFSLLLAMNMGCTLFGLTAEEALAGATVNGARALGLGAGSGTVAAGAPADLAIWNAGAPAELAYGIGHRPLHGRFHGGRLV